MKRSLSAIQPTGIVHIGNYIGAISQFVKLQNETKAFYFLVDYHAITVPFSPKELHENLLNAAAMYLAAGLDPKKATIFQQSQVPQHTELAWILNAITKMGEAERMTQFKDKASKGAERASVGLFTYPILMAADILLYDTDIVPVGDDQKQHVELARDLAERFNKEFGKTFIVPEPHIKKTGARIMSLDDPTSKMSKSAKSSKSYIALSDDDKTIEKKIKSATTDSMGTISYDPTRRPGVSNLITIMAEVTGVSTDSVVKDFDGKGYKEFKESLAEALVNFIRPIREKQNKLLSDKAGLIKILEKGSHEARGVAEEKMMKVRKAIGITL
ncbi:MAG: tryptophan--tRNA ligase [bacterium]|nr:tryptophan--tRNA ligase [bacterium]